jgi:hypothetical protein
MLDNDNRGQPVRHHGSTGVSLPEMPAPESDAVDAADEEALRLLSLTDLPAAHARP